jgi:hypothetical protein
MAGVGMYACRSSACGWYSGGEVHGMCGYFVTHISHLRLN